MIHLQRREREVELVRVVLVHQPDARARVAVDLSRGGLQLSEQQLDQRRLAVAVLTKQHDPAAENTTSG